jgi:hypothetical protein
MGFLTTIHYGDGDRHVPENAWVELLMDNFLELLFLYDLSRGFFNTKLKMLNK